MNIITKLKNVRKKAQREVSAWQLQFPKRLKLGISYNYLDEIQDIADMVSIYECRQLGISANWKELNSFLLLNMVKARQLSRLASAAKKKNKLVKLSELIYSFNNPRPDLRKVSFV